MAWLIRQNAVAHPQRRCRNGRERAPNLHERKFWRHTLLPIDHVAKNHAVESYDCFFKYVPFMSLPTVVTAESQILDDVGIGKIFVRTYSNNVF